ncbi:MAG: hypothetical protein ACI4EI_01495, partial [Muricoprocola sp.]
TVIHLFPITVIFYAFLVDRNLNILKYGHLASTKLPICIPITFGDSFFITELRFYSKISRGTVATEQ